MSWSGRYDAQAGEPETGGEKMLLKITDGQALDERRLMDVYAESNLETVSYTHLTLPTKA